MYTSYSTLQRKQLTKQVYTDTQSTYLLVYAPGRHQALVLALVNQLHRKFRLVDRLGGMLVSLILATLTLLLLYKGISVLGLMEGSVFAQSQVLHFCSEFLNPDVAASGTV